LILSASIKAQQSYSVQECDATAAQQHSYSRAQKSTFAEATVAKKNPTCQRQMGEYFRSFASLRMTEEN